jgi:hypothetical protein
LFFVSARTSSMIPLVLKEDSHDDDKTQYHKRKQVSRILKHLKNQLQEKQQIAPKKMPLPSDTLIDRWVHSSLRHHNIEGSDWQKIIYSTLQAIHSQQQESTLELDERINNTHVEHFLLQLLLLTDRKEMYFR